MRRTAAAALALALAATAALGSPARGAVPPPYACAEFSDPGLVTGHPGKVHAGECAPPPGAEFCPYVTVYGVQVLIVCVVP